MILKGKFAEAKVFADVIDYAAIDSIKKILNLSSIEGASISIMPDVHKCSEYAVVGYVQKGGKIMPSLVSADIACGMEVYKIEEKEIDFPRFDRIVKEVNSTIHEKAKFDFSRLRCPHNDKKALDSISCGGGNHFIEIDKDEEGNLYLVIHSGSRNLGGQIYKYYQELAYKNCNSIKEEKVALIKKLKEEGREKEIQTELNKIHKDPISKETSYLEGKNLEDYIHDCQIANAFSIYNRTLIVESIMEEYGLHGSHYITCIHNYVDEEGIVRKGAISAKKGELVYVPISQRDGGLILEGLGNEEFLHSAPHGAGRLMSRSQAKELISLEDAKESMKGIYTTSVTEETIDEACFAYKSIEDIIPQLENTCNIIKRILPIYNFKEEETRKF